MWLISTSEEAYKWSGWNLSCNSFVIVGVSWLVSETFYKHLPSAKLSLCYTFNVYYNVYVCQNTYFKLGYYLKGIDATNFPDVATDTHIRALQQCNQ